MGVKYKPEDLFDSITSHVELRCTNCGEWDNFHNVDEFEGCGLFFDRGWRATKSGNLYCPECAKKKLKS